MPQPPRLVHQRTKLLTPACVAPERAAHTSITANAPWTHVLALYLETAGRHYQAGLPVCIHAHPPLSYWRQFLEYCVRIEYLRPDRAEVRWREGQLYAAAHALACPEYLTLLACEGGYDDHPLFCATRAPTNTTADPEV